MGLALIARAVATGVAATLVLRYGVGMPLAALLRSLAVEHAFARLVMAAWVPPLVAVLVSMASGWVVARFNRPTSPSASSRQGAHSTSAVVIYAIFINVWSLPRTYTVVTNAFDDVRFVPALISHGTGIVAATIGVLAGGWLANPGRPRIPERVTPVL